MADINSVIRAKGRAVETILSGVGGAVLSALGAEASWLSDNIAGFGVGWVAGDDWRLRAYVKTKMPDDVLESLNSFAPWTAIQALAPIQIVVSGSFQALAGNAAGAGVSPLKVGATISSTNVKGTLGAFVKAAAGPLMLLSCRHVLIAVTGSTTVRESITAFDTRDVARVVAFSKLTADDNSLGAEPPVGDWALATVNEGIAPSTMLPGTLRNLIPDPIPPAANARAVLASRTQLTGTIQDVSADLMIDYPHDGTKVVPGLFLILGDGGAFAEEGDSGALVVDQAAPNPNGIGIVVAGANTLQGNPGIAASNQHFTAAMPLMNLFATRGLKFIA